MDIRREELPLALLMFGYFFLVITTFWVLKPIKKQLFVTYYDEVGFDLLGWHLGAAQAEQLAKVLNMVVAFGAVIVFSVLARRLRRQKLTLTFCGFFALAFVAYAFLVDRVGDGLVWSFYLFGDLYNTVMVATFFAFLNDSVKPAAARRLYGVVVLGGVGGGAFGSTYVRVWIEQVDTSFWMWTCLGTTALVSLLAWGAGRVVDRGASAMTREEPAVAKDEGGEPRAPDSPATEGAKLVVRSSYLLSIVGVVGIYEIVSTILDFQFTAAVTEFLSGDAIGEQISTVYAATNITSLVVQLGLTSFVMGRFRLTVALLVMPVALLTSSTVFLVLPLLWPGSILSISDNALNYSVNQSGKEALYTPTSRDEKYAAKAFIDMFVQRSAKALGVGLNLLMTELVVGFSGVRWLSIVAIVLIGVWVLAARHAGRGFESRTTVEGEPRGPARGTG